MSNFARRPRIVPTFTTRYYVDLGILGEDVELEVTFTYSEGRPGRMYMPNGDPGYPDEPAEFDIEEIRIMDSAWPMPANQKKPEPISGEFADRLTAELQDSDEFAEHIADQMNERANDAAEAYYDSLREERMIEGYPV